MGILNSLAVYFWTSISIIQVIGIVFEPRGGINGSVEFECGASASFVCMSAETPFDIGLRVNDTEAITCYYDQCFPGSAAPAIYTYTYNTTAGFVVAHIRAVDAADASTVFKCEKGSDSLQLRPIIKVFPKNDTSNMTLTNTKVTVTTGCTRLNNALKFEWYKSKNKNGTGAEFLETTIPTIDNTYCIPSDHCEGNGYSSTYTFKDQDDVTSYYIKCVVNVTENDKLDVILISNQTVSFKVTNDPIWHYIEHIPCWNVGVIFVAVIILINSIIFATVRYKISNTKTILFQCVLNRATLAFGIVIPVNLVIVLVVRFVQKRIKDYVDTFPCWAIFLIILVFLVLFVVGCLIWIILDPVSDAKTISRTVTGNTMTLKIAWSARLYKLKTFYAQFESDVNEPVRKEMTYLPRYDLSSECQISGLSLDYYQVHVHSYICHLRSLGKTVVFDKKGRALPPQLFTEDEKLRTEASVSLKWTPTKGKPQYFVVKYKKKKSMTQVWKHTQNIKENSVTIDGLNPGTNYLFKILAVNNVGPSDESKVLTIRTNAIKALPPEHFEKIAVSENEVILSWNPNHTIKKQEFILKYCNMTDTPPTGCQRYEDTVRIPYDGSNEMHYTLRGLRAGSDYSLEIFTQIGKRTSENSQILRIKTEGKYDAAKYDDYSRKENLRTSRFELQAHKGEKKLNRPISEY